MPVALWGKTPLLVDSLVIWRYQSIDATLNTIYNRTLRFTQLRQLGDTWEGTIGLATLEAQRNLYTEIAKHFGRALPDPEQELQRMQLLNRFHNYVSCWTVVPPDRILMWNAFTENSQSCAISTAVGALMGSLINEPTIADIGFVKYSNHELVATQGMDMRDEIYWKRIFFDFEKEIRFTINTTFEQPEGERLLLTESPYRYEYFVITLSRVSSYIQDAAKGHLSIYRRFFPSIILG